MLEQPALAHATNISVGYSASARCVARLIAKDAGIFENDWMRILFFHGWNDAVGLSFRRHAVTQWREPPYYSVAPASSSLLPGVTSSTIF